MNSNPSTHSYCISTSFANTFSLGHLQQLTRLHLSKALLLPSLPDDLSQLHNLQSLHVSNHRQLTGELPEWIFSLTNLTSLTISENNFSGSIPDTISNLKQLRELRLGEQILSGPNPESIGALADLELIWLEGNGLSGTIPATIGNLTALTTLKLVHNKLSGSIPQAVSSLKRLKQLNLNQNNLSGSIPEEFGHLRQLWELKLSESRLAGTIPASVTILTNLAYLHLDNNQLTGVLPSFHHMTHLTSPDMLSAAYNYLTATADAFPFNTSSPDPDDPSGGHSACLFTYNCLEWVYCGHGLSQRRDSECRAFCGVQAQPLTPPCSGHGMCSFVSDRSLDMARCYDEDERPPDYCDFEGQCTCDEGYTPGAAAGTCVSHDTLLVPQASRPLLIHPAGNNLPFEPTGTYLPFEPPGTTIVGVILSDLQAPKNLLLLLLLLPQLLMAFSLPHLLRRLKKRTPTRYFFSKRAFAAQQASMGVEIAC
ncbi:unnamed protein product [Closterium sp. Yama58-4]|nr:unnamed protein product [Closterium sp. Yama58-4]